jgi:excisionase family DNA binding protein
MPFTDGMEPKIQPILVSIKDGAGLLGVCPRTVQNLITARKLKARKIGRRTLLSYRELQAFARRDHASIAGPEQAQQTLNSAVGRAE